jgi:hypothetical protein
MMGNSFTVYTHTRWLVMTITWSRNSDSSSLAHHFFWNQKTRQRWTAPDGPQRQHVDVHQPTGHPGDRSRELPGPPGRANTADVGDSWVSIDGAVPVILVCCNSMIVQDKIYDITRTEMTRNIASDGTNCVKIA